MIDLSNADMTAEEWADIKARHPTPDVGVKLMEEWPNYWFQAEYNGETYFSKSKGISLNGFSYLVLHRENPVRQQLMF